jgi:hypothetical protein
MVNDQGPKDRKDGLVADQDPTERKDGLAADQVFHPGATVRSQRLAQFLFYRCGATGRRRPVALLLPIA